MEDRARLGVLAIAVVAAAIALVTLAHGDGAARAARDESPLARVLRQYDIPVESQLLVFSKTSLQRDRITEENPRAIYFNDRASVGVVPGSPLIEVASFDTLDAGVSFFTIDETRPDALPERKASCFRCHALAESGGMQGLLMRSAGVHDHRDPHRCFEEIDDSTPYTNRWGGWYVSGRQVPRGHAGRALPPSLRTTYSGNGSDVVALLVLGHQVAAVNLIAQVARQARLAEGDARDGRAPDMASLRAAASALAEYLLFTNEAPLPAAVSGNPAFVQAFESAGVRDSHGHSLRTLDLQRRLLKVPCSFMIHAPAFVSLPSSARQLVYDRMSTILLEGSRPAARRFTPDERDAIVHVLRATLPDLPVGFGAADGRS